MSGFLKLNKHYNFRRYQCAYTHFIFVIFIGANLS